MKSIQLNNSQEALGQLPFILDLNIVTWHNLASDLMALVTNAIHLLDATLVFYSYFSKALTQLFFSFFYLVYFQSAIIAFDLSSKDLSPLLPGFYCSTVSSSRLRMSSLGWYCDSHGKEVYSKMKTTISPFSSPKRTCGKGWAVLGSHCSVPSSSCQARVKPLKSNSWCCFFATLPQVFSKVKQSISWLLNMWWWWPHYPSSSWTVRLCPIS